MTNYTFDQSTFRYRDESTGRFVSGSQVRSDLDAVLEGTQARTRAITQQLVDGKLSLGDWQTKMQQEIKASHVASGILGRGGVESTTQADYGRMGHIIKGEYAALRQWAKDLESGKAPLDGRALSRADLYQEAGRGTFEEVKRFAAKEAGLVWERSRLEPSANHCDDCENEAAQGWQPTGVIIPIGDRTCGRRCRCELEQSADKGDDAEEAA